MSSREARANGHSCCGVKASAHQEGRLPGRIDSARQARLIPLPADPIAELEAQGKAKVWFKSERRVGIRIPTRRISSMPIHRSAFVGLVVDATRKVAAVPLSDLGAALDASSVQIEHWGQSFLVF